MVRNLVPCDYNMSEFGHIKFNLSRIFLFVLFGDGGWGRGTVITVSQDGGGWGGGGGGGGLPIFSLTSVIKCLLRQNQLNININSIGFGYGT